MNYQILFIQGAGNVTVAEEQVIVDGLKAKLEISLRLYCHTFLMLITPRI